MPTRLKHLRITKIALVPAGANPEAHVLLYKSAVWPPEEERVETVTKAIYDAKVVELEAQIAALTTRLEKATPPDPEDIWKGVNPALKKMYEEQTDRTRKAEEAIAVEKAARERVIFIGKASAYKYLPIKADDDWEVFKGLATLPQPQQDRLEQLLKAAEELGRLAALTKVHGRDLSGGPPSDDPGEQLETLAREKVTKGLAKTEAEGMRLATQERPDLYRAHTRRVQREERD